MPAREIHVHLVPSLLEPNRLRGSVAVVITSTLLLLWFLDHPYGNSVGSLRPVAMERTVDQLTHEKGIADRRFAIPCDAQGAKR